MATDPEVVIATARGWIGTPYIHQASLKGKGCDCVGMLRGVWRDIHHADDPEVLPPYTPDWAEATGRETLYQGLARHLTEIPLSEIKPGSVVVFRMRQTGPAKHCGIIGARGGTLTLIPSRMNKVVNEEPFTTYWRRKLAYAFEVS